MTVHMIRVYTEPPKNDNHFNKMWQACENWVATYNETLETERMELTHVIPSQEGGDGPEHTEGQWRFAWSDDHTTLLDDLETDLQPEVKWYRLKYHQCPHDESDPTGCEWDETKTREFGTVPAGL